MASALSQIRAAVPPCDAAALGIRHPGRVFANLSSAALVEHAVRRGEAALTDLGAITAFTGPRTGRSPKDKFTVKEGAPAEQIDWTANQPMDPAVFDRLRDLVRAGPRAPRRNTVCRCASSPKRRGTACSPAACSCGRRPTNW